MANFIEVTFLAYQEKDPDKRSQDRDDEEYQQVLEELDLVDEQGNESNTALETGYVNIDHIFAMIPYDEGTLIQRPVGSAMYVDEPQEQIIKKINEAS
jgi:hypothetical protein